jgi:hypothetical protein
LRSITELSSPRFNSIGGGKKIADRTADIAMRRMRLQKDIEMIDQAAVEADSEIYQYIIKNVADGIPYEYLQVPTGRRKFYEVRVKFFVLLAAKRG